MGLTADYMRERRPLGDTPLVEGDQPDLDSFSRALLSGVIDAAIATLDSDNVERFELDAKVSIEGIHPGPNHPGGCMRVCMEVGGRRICFHSVPL